MKKTCANCDYNDGNVYTSNPPMYKCTITGVFADANHECDIEFAPVKHSKWIKQDGLYCCSACGKVAPYEVKEDTILYWGGLKYCYNCGAKMN